MNRVSTRADASVPYEYTSEAAWESPYPTFNAAPPDLMFRAPKMCTTAPPDCTGAAGARRIEADGRAFGCGFHRRIHDARPPVSAAAIALRSRHASPVTERQRRGATVGMIVREDRTHAIHAKRKLCSSARGNLTSAAWRVRWVGAGEWVMYASHPGPLANIFAAAFS